MPYYLGVLYRLLAGAVVVLHGLFIAFVVAGGFLAWRWRWVAALHLPCAAWGAWIEVRHGVCPLTPLENYFRAKAGLAGYGGGFIEHYLVPVIYPGGLTARTQVLLGAAVVLLNVAVYAPLVRRLRGF